MQNKTITIQENMKLFFKKRDPYIVIFRGGSGAKSLSKALYQVTHRLGYVIPLTDNGGSTAAIIEAIGGPGIGDIRNTLTELLIWRNIDHFEKTAIAELFNYRIGKQDNDTLIEFMRARNTLQEDITRTLATIRSGENNTVRSFNEWNALIHGHHPLLQGFNNDRKGLLLREFKEVNHALIGKDFDFVGASLGNLFLSGARLGTGRLSSAILQFREMANIEEEVFPIVDSNKQLTINAQLQNGEIITGQKNISYEPADNAHITHIDKENNFKLPSPIVTINYINKDNQPFSAKVNNDVCAAIDRSDLIIYAYGSFWTSLMPSLTVQGLSNALAKSRAPKLFLPNGYPDRETAGMTIFDMVSKMTQGLNQASGTDHATRSFITDIGHLQGSLFERGNIRESRVHTLFAEDQSAEKLRYNTDYILDLIIKLLR